MEYIIRKLLHLSESIIDYPKAGLSSDVWIEEQGTYKLRGSVKRKILSTLESYQEGLIGVAKKDEDGNPMVNIIGSIGTNQYTRDSDVDVHIVVSEDSKFYDDEKARKVVKEFFEADGNRAFIGSHKIEVFLQPNMNVDLMSESVYNVFSGEWLKGPKILPSDYDPYDDFSELFDEIRNHAKEFDLEFGELRRDVIDYKTMKQVLGQIPGDKRGEIHGAMVKKLGEMESDIKRLRSGRKDLVNFRRLKKEPQTPEQALKDVEIAKEWKDKNAVFKFLSRYKYISVIKELEALIDDGIDDSEVSDIADEMGV